MALTQTSVAEPAVILIRDFKKERK